MTSYGEARMTYASIWRPLKNNQILRNAGWSNSSHRKHLQGLNSCFRRNMSAPPAARLL